MGIGEFFRRFVMAKVYTTFEELVEHNKSVFSLVGPSEGENHLCRAVWDAREAEVHQYEETLGEKNILIEKLEKEWAKAQEEHQSLAQGLRALEEEKRDLTSRLEGEAQRAQELEEEKWHPQEGPRGIAGPSGLPGGEGIVPGVP